MLKEFISFLAYSIIVLGAKLLYEILCMSVCLSVCSSVLSSVFSSVCLDTVSFQYMTKDHIIHNDSLPFLGTTNSIIHNDSLPLWETNPSPLNYIKYIN